MSKKVFIGAGHGGKDPGTSVYITEKEYNLKTAKLVSQYLKEAGVEYKLSRTADVDTDMDGNIKTNYSKIARAYADGILKTLGITVKMTVFRLLSLS